jgi:riboflavin kinase / FMN adenylyltransferase
MGAAAALTARSRIASLRPPGPRPPLSLESNAIMEASRPAGAPAHGAFTVHVGAGPVPAELQGAVAAIGNFDGLHRGHQAVLAAARRLAAERARPCVMLTFDPHPRLFFQPQVPLFRLTPGALKLAVAERLGLDGAIVLPFDAALAATSAADFVARLSGELALSGVVVGHDFHFGRGREGSPAFIAEKGAAAGLSVDVVSPFLDGTAPVSSSAVRDALRAGDVAMAGRLLGYRWIVRSTVQHGEKRGRELGYPTANLALPADCGLRHGIYAVRVAIDGVVREGVASFGRRPTFDNGAPLLEVFVFDFTGDLYGKQADVEFVAWIRGEEKFDSLEALVARMDQDSLSSRTAIALAASGDAAPSFLPLPR